MSENEIVEAPVVESPAVEQTPAAEPVKESFDETIERVAREVTTGGLRGPDGKFQPRVAAPGAPEAAEVPGSPQTAPPDPAPPVIEAPQSLPADVKAKWASLSPDWQEYLSKREGDIHQKLTSDGERLKTLSAFEEVAKSVEPRLRQVNAPPAEYFRRLAAADELLSTNGIAGLQQIAQMYGIDLRAAAQIGNQPGFQPTQIPDVNALVDQRVQARLYERTVAEKETEIGKFRSALPADEQADFDALEPVMAGLYGAKPNLTLQDLYKAARKVDSNISAKDEARAAAERTKAAEEEAKKKAAQDARLAPLGKRPGSAPTGPIKGGDFWDTFDRVGKEVLARSN